MSRIEGDPTPSYTTSAVTGFEAAMSTTGWLVHVLDDHIGRDATRCVCCRHMWRRDTPNLHFGSYVLSAVSAVPVLHEHHRDCQPRVLSSARCCIYVL
jgi:hypothetical protein